MTKNLIQGLEQGAFSVIFNKLSATAFIVGGRGCRGVNEDRRGERDEGSLVEVADFLALVGLGGVRAVYGIVGHEGFVVIFPEIAFGQFLYPLVDRLSGLFSLIISKKGYVPRNISGKFGQTPKSTSSMRPYVKEMF